MLGGELLGAGLAEGFGGEALLGGMADWGLGAGMAEGIGSGIASAGMGAGADALGWGGMMEGTAGLDALGSLAGAGAAGGNLAGEWAALEGTPTLTMGGDVLPAGGFASEAGFEGAPQFVDDAIGKTWYPQSMQEVGDLAGISRPVQGALSTANKARGLYNAASGLNNMVNPPARPTSVGGLGRVAIPLQNQQQPWNPAFGPRPPSHSIRGARS
jgi:hypothetical protein